MLTIIAAPTPPSYANVGLNITGYVVSLNRLTGLT